MGIKFNSNAKYTLDMAIRLALQRALLCEVSSNLRMVACDWSDREKQISVFFYFDGHISEENKDSVSCIIAEVSGDFDEETLFIDTCIELDFPNNLPIHKCTVYRRKE